VELISRRHVLVDLFPGMTKEVVDLGGCMKFLAKGKEMSAPPVNQTSAIQHLVSRVTHLQKGIYTFNSHLPSLQVISEFEIMFSYVV
jgi:hypothetical protein